jgi:hypothetical protein
MVERALTKRYSAMALGPSMKVEELVGEAANS